MISNTLRYWLAAIYLPGIGPRRFFHWLANFSNVEKLFQASSDELQNIGLTAQQIHAIQHPNWKQVESDLAWTQQLDQHLISYDDPSYPSLLKESADPPLVLFVRGDKNVLASLQIAMVGSRHASPSGISNAEEFARYLAQAGFTITSGLALGVDGASHRGALAVGGKTIGVAGTGLNHIYPAAHRKLIESIIESHGAVISEFPLTMPPLSANFPRRNRIISGLSVGVLVVEAALKSGSLITAKFALEQGREVFAMPGSIQNPLVRGCHYLIRQGAKLVETVDDVLQELRAFCVTNVPKQNEVRENLTSKENLLLKQIAYENTPMDVIILRSSLTTSEVSSILLALELKGYIQSVPGGYIRIA